ncbi:hypothetical protein RHOER0001_6675 [Rhodococcus erythropolis SK121]|nr:hypothetical protein RHOER0001_6675 [Rhodococcus erythropolis SK121]
MPPNRSRPGRAKVVNALIVTAPIALREQLTGLHKNRVLVACRLFPRCFRVHRNALRGRR